MSTRTLFNSKQWPINFTQTISILLQFQMLMVNANVAGVADQQVKNF
jgi:hypothetical protein